MQNAGRDVVQVEESCECYNDGPRAWGALMDMGAREMQSLVPVRFSLSLSVFI